METKGGKVWQKKEKQEKELLSYVQNAKMKTIVRQKTKEILQIV